MRPTYPIYQNTGTPIKLSYLKPGDWFKYDGYPNACRLLDVMPEYLKISRSDTWIVRLYKSNEKFNQIVYVDNN